jgi:hypothetical protein
MEHFEKLDVLLWPSGLKFLINSRNEKWVRYFCLCFTLFNIVSCSYHDGKHIFIIPGIFTFGDYIFWLACWACYINLFCRRNEILKLLWTFDGNMSKEAFRDLRRLSVRLAILVGVYYGLLLATQTPLGISYEHWKWKVGRITIFGETISEESLNPWKMVVTYLFRLHEVWITNWMSFSLALYILFHRMMTHCFVDHLNEIGGKIHEDKNLMLKTGLKTASDLRLIQRLKRIRSRFELAFNFFPFLSLFQNFFLTSCYIMHMFADTSLATHHMVVIPSAIMQGVQLILPFFLIHCINRDKRSLEAAVENMILTASSRRSVWVGGMRDPVLCQEMKELSAKTSTAWNLFKLDNNLVTSFAASLLSFSVLFVQIPQMKK